MKTRTRLLTLPVLGMLGASLAFNGANATVINVPGDYGTIQAAINAATPGDTITVAAGTWGGAGIDKQVILLGPNAGINPNGGTRVAEAVFTSGSPVFRIATTDPVTIDGFTFDGCGLAVDSYTTGNRPTIRNNIIKNTTTMAFFLANSATLTFADNFLMNLADDEGIFVAGNWNGSAGTTVTITGNVWQDTLSSGMNLSCVSGTISGNHFQNVQYYGVLLANQSEATIANNVFDGIINPNPAASATWGAGVRFYTPAFTGPVIITDNLFTHSYVGVAVRAGGDITGMDIQVHQNSFVGNSSAGIKNSGSGTLDATCNWWGSANGPSGIGLGSGDAVSADVTYAPWLMLPPPSPCIGGTPLGTKMAVLATLQGLSGGNKQTTDKLNQAVDHLVKSIEPSLWLDPTHVADKAGQKVFQEEKDTVNKLMDLLKDKKNTLPAGTLEPLIAQLVGADRDLAEVAIAECTNVKASAKAQDELLKGDDELAKGKPENAIEHYRKAWEHATK